MTKTTLLAWFVSALAVIAPAQIRGSSITVTVDGRSGPWSWTTNGLNDLFQFGVNNHQAPTVVSAADGLDFTPGNRLAVEYASGLIYEGGGWPLNDAGGALWYGPVNDDTNFAAFPSFYFKHADYPAYSAGLVGTFADDSGAVVGTPFNIGNFRYLTIPVGATRLQLGDNDVYFSDNSGSWQIRVSEVPQLQITSVGHLVLRAPAGSTNRIEYISELSATNWQTMTNLTIPQSPLEIIDPDFGRFPRRFYRAVLLP